MKPTTQKQLLIWLWRGLENIVQYENTALPERRRGNDKQYAIHSSIFRTFKWRNSGALKENLLYGFLSVTAEKGNFIKTLRNKEIVHINYPQILKNDCFITEWSNIDLGVSLKRSHIKPQSLKWSSAFIAQYLQCIWKVYPTNSEKCIKLNSI